MFILPAWNLSNPIPTPSPSVVQESVLELIDHSPGISPLELFKQLPYTQEQVTEALLMFAKQRSYVSNIYNYYGKSSNYTCKGIFRVTPVCGQEGELVAALQHAPQVSRVELFENPLEESSAIICVTVFGTSTTELYYLKSKLFSMEMLDNQIEDIQFECRDLEPHSGW